MKFIQYGGKIYNIDKIAHISILDDCMLVYGELIVMGKVDLEYKEKLFQDLKVNTGKDKKA